MTAGIGRILHQLPGRLRIQITGLDEGRASLTAALHQLADLDGIERVRLNPAAASLTVDFDPRRLSREGLLARLATATAAQSRAARPPPDIRPVVRSALGLVITPRLPPPLRFALRSTRAAIRVSRGLTALLHQGSGTDVLHAIAVYQLVSRQRLDLVGRLEFLVALGRYLTARRLYPNDDQGPPG